MTGPAVADEVGKLDPAIQQPGCRRTTLGDGTRVTRRREDVLADDRPPDGQPNTATIAGYWLDEAFYFTTGPGEQKERNLAHGTPHVTIVTGTNGWDGLDVVLEGQCRARD